MKENMTQKRFGEIFTSTFKVFFKKFISNFLVAIIFMIISGLLMIPYFISTLSLDVGIGYPFYQDNIGNMIAFGFGLILMMFSSYAILPSLFTGYFAPRTFDTLEGKERDEKERRQILFSSFTRILIAKICQTILILIPILAIIAIGYFSYSGIAMTNMIYQWDRMIILLFAYFAVMILVFVFYLFSLFTGQFALFEGKKGFRAVFASVKLVSNGNFWITLGHYILFALIISTAVSALTLPISLIAILTIIPSSMLLVGIGGTIAMIVGGVIMAFLLLLVYAVFYGLNEVFVCHLYFNAKLRAEDVEFPNIKSEEFLE